MGKGVNKAIIIGNLGQDPEVKYMPNGNAVANITIATSESWKDKNTGEKVEKTEWHRVVFFKRLAEIVGEYLKKGSKVYVEGQLRTRKWDKDGQTHYSTEIVAREMQMLDGQSSQGVPQPQAGQNQEPPKQAVPDGANDFDDDIPFMSYEYKSVI